MVHKLRRKFIRIAMVSVTLVMLLMAVSINTINFLSTDSDLEHTLVMIRENAGNMPQFSPAEKPGPKREERFSPEKPYSTRYFVLYYTPSGTLTQADMKHISPPSRRRTPERIWRSPGSTARASAIQEIINSMWWIPAASAWPSSWTVTVSCTPCVSSP